MQRADPEAPRAETVQNSQYLQRKFAWASATQYHVAGQIWKFGILRTAVTSAVPTQPNAATHNVMQLQAGRMGQ